MLEGERGAIEATYRRIARDRRHTGMMHLLGNAIAAREFQEWLMAFIGNRSRPPEAVALVTRSLSTSSNANEVACALVTFISRAIEDEAPARADVLPQ